MTTPEREEDAPRMAKVEAAMISFIVVYYKSLQFFVVSTNSLIAV